MVVAYFGMYKKTRGTEHAGANPAISTKSADTGIDISRSYRDNQEDCAFDGDDLDSTLLTTEIRTTTLIYIRYASKIWKNYLNANEDTFAEDFGFAMAA